MRPWRSPVNGKSALATPSIWSALFDAGANDSIIFNEGF